MTLIIHPSQYEEAAQILRDSNQYRLQKKYSLKKNYNIATPETILKKGLILDTETTGLDYKTDEIINIGLVQFTYDDSGKVYQLVKMYIGFQEPSVAIPKEITDLTTITDEMVAGKKFDTDKITSMIKESDIIIAHNSTFDRAFVDRFFPISKVKIWCDSQSQVNWIHFGLKDTKLPTIARNFNFYFDEHLAINDCLAVADILTKQINNKQVLSYLLDTTNEDLYYIKAIKSPFDKKEILKTKNYTWNSSERIWAKVVKKEEIEQEKQFLAEEIYTKVKNESTVEKVNRVDLFKS